MAITTLSDLNGLYNLIYEGALLVAREQNLMAQLVDNRSASGWMNRRVTTRPQISMSDATDGTDFASPTTFGVSQKAQLTPAEKIAMVELTDQEMETDPYGAVRDATLELGGAAATKVDSDLCGLFSSFTTDKGPGAAASATMASIGAGVAVVGNAKARQFGAVNIVLHPYHWHDIWLELGQPAATKANLAGITETALRDYYMSDMLSANWWTTSNIAVDGSDDAVSGIFTRPAIMLDTRRAPRLETDRDASKRATEYVLTIGYAHGLVRSEFGVKYTADAAEPA